MNNNVKVVVDAGHGGTDSGAVNGNFYEKDFNLKAANYIYNRLKELGIPAVMTRTEDEYLPKNDRIERVNEISDRSPEIILVSNHMNAGGGEGAEVVYALRNDSTLATMILDNIGEAGQIKRKAYQRRLPENPNLDYYYIIRETDPRESILIEYGFVDNANDLAKLQNNLDEYAEGVVKAIADYINVPYTKPGVSNGEVEEKYYIVQKGDTLWSIANKYGITVDELKSLNNLTSNVISIGQRLKIVSMVPEGVYIVQKGDTLWSIANKYGITVDELKLLNNLTSNIISIGQELKIPSNNEEEIYIVQKGDSLWAIANKYGIPVNDLVNYNNLDSLTLKIGQELRIPSSNRKYHTVVKGDTLWSIAQKYNTTVDKIITANNLMSTILSVGQNLIIP